MGHEEQRPAATKFARGSRPSATDRRDLYENHPYAATESDVTSVLRLERMPEQNQITLMHATAEAAPARSAPLSAPTLADVLGSTSSRDDRARDTRGFFLRRVLVGADVLALVCAFAVAEMAGGLRTTSAHSVQRDLVLLALAIPVWVLLARAHDLYHVDSRRADHNTADEFGPIVWMTTLWSWSILLVGSLSGLREIAVPRIALFWVATAVLLVILRSVARAWSRRQLWYLQNVLVVGTIEEAATVISKIQRHPEYGMHVVAGVELPTGEKSRRPHRVAEVGPVPVVRGDVDLIELLEQLDVDRVILAPSLHWLPDCADVLSDLQEMEVHVDMVPSWCEVVGSRVELHQLEGMPLITIPYVGLARSSLVIKRALDIVGAAAALFLLLPLIAICAIAIKLDSKGPVFFRQRRVGRDDRRFEVIKFRSMQADADEIKDQVAELNFHGGGNDTGMFKIAGDPRITRVGRLLRRCSLDELPQLFNVLKGDMSLVGPRPLIETEYCQIAGRHRRRISLTPGLTGLWQVSGRSDIPFEGMIDLDYLYVTNWSLWGDIKLITRTFGAVARGHGAY